MASKTSAVADEPIEVLFALHNKFDLMDFAGPLEVLTTALHDAQDASELPRPVFVPNPAASFRSHRIQASPTRELLHTYPSEIQR